MLKWRDMPAVGRIPPKCKTPHFPYQLVLLSRIRNHGIQRSGSASAYR